MSQVQPFIPVVRKQCFDLILSRQYVIGRQ